MLAEGDRWYAALAARDARFDGVFFVGVSTTGIYCRPICVARTPGRDRCEFFTDAAHAEQAGYRACFRCRPEGAPGLGSVDARSRIVRAALTRVDAGCLNDGSVAALAAELGVTARHLRRAIEQEVGVPLVEIAQSRRLALARRLLADTRMSLAAIAFASGFRSLRRFNAAFARRFGRAPSRLRGAHPAGASPTGPIDDAAIALRLAFRPPLPWRALLGFLGARAITGVEEVTTDGYRRTVRYGDDVGIVSVSMDPGGSCLRASIATDLVGHLMKIVARVRMLFDLDARPDVVAERLAADPLLGPSVRAAPGLRVPGAFDPFEAAVRAVLGQQISVRAATTLAGRLAARFGLELRPPACAALSRTFPSPGALASVPVAALASIGLPTARAATLRALAELFAAPGFHRHLDAGERDEVARQLKAVPGIGDWTAAYVAMRALHDPDAFPAGDLGVRRALGGLGPKAAAARAEAWRPWRAYAVMHLWSAAPPQRSQERT